MNTNDIDRLLGRLPSQSVDLLMIFYRAHSETWIIAWNQGDNLSALQAAVDWSTTPDLAFTLADAVVINEKITMETYHP